MDPLCEDGQRLSRFPERRRVKFRGGAAGYGACSKARTAPNHVPALSFVITMPTSPHPRSTTLDAPNRLVEYTSW